MDLEAMATKTDRTKRKTVSTALLEQLVELDAASLSREMARKFLELGFRSSDQKCAHALSEKARQGTLSPAEDHELDELIHVGNLLAILQSKARQALKRSEGDL